MTEYDSHRATTPFEAMIELQRTTLEASREMVSQSLSLQRETLALSWRAFALPLTDAQRETTATRQAATPTSEDSGAIHRTVDVVEGGNAVETRDRQRRKTVQTPRTLRDDSSDSGSERSVSGEETADGTATDTTWVEEDTEPSTEMVEDAVRGTNEDVEPLQRSALRERVRGIGDSHSESLHDAGIESLAALADARPDDVAEAADITVERASEWIQRARAASTRGVDLVDVIGDVHAEALHEAGIETVPGLAETDADDVAEAADVSDDEAQAWVDEAQQRQEEGIRTVAGIGETRADSLHEAGVESVGDLAAADAERVADAVDVSTERASEWIRNAQT